MALRHALNLTASGWLSLEPDRLLSWYRKEAGLETQGEELWRLGGGQDRGHSLGHYLRPVHECIRTRVMCGSSSGWITSWTNSPSAEGGRHRLHQRDAEREEDLRRGGARDIRSSGFDLNGSWSPWYNLHKVHAGLLDARWYCDNAKALEVAARFGDWAIETTKNLTDEQWQKMLACEYGGMNESLADLYAATGETKYLDLAKKFYDHAVMDALAAGRDELSGNHANTQIPKAIGAARIYELTGDPKFGGIARNFTAIVRTNHTYVTGGNSDGGILPVWQVEQPARLETTETCNT